MSSDVSPVFQLPLLTNSICWQISSESLSPSRSGGRSTSLTRRRPCDASARPSSQIMARYRPRSRSCPFFATSSSTTFATSLSWIGPEKRNSGRTSSRWYVHLLTGNRIEGWARNRSDMAFNLVSRVLCWQADFLLRGPTGGDEAPEAGYQGAEIGRADDGLRHRHLLRL